MIKGFENLAKKSAEKVYEYFGKSSGKMLLATSIIGISTSCLAQTAAIICNKKYTTPQKAFMIPQELVEGMITVFSIFMITKPLQKFTAKYVSTGKLISKELTSYLKDNNLSKNIGNKDFNIRTSIENTIMKLESTDEFIHSSQQTRENILNKHKQAMEDYDSVYDSALAYATTAGAVISTGVIAPLLRNKAASSYQSININVINNIKEKKLCNANSPVFKSNQYPSQFSINCKI